MTEVDPTAIRPPVGVDLPYEPERSQENKGLAASLHSPIAFLWRYVTIWPGHFFWLTVVVVTASLSGIASQYGMKLLVDAMEKPPAHNTAVWFALFFFVGLFALEAALWRVSGWLGCRTSVGVGVDIRLDLLNYVTGHPMRYFQDQRAGSLGHRITATAGDFSAMINKLTWNVAPPVVNFLGALLIFFTINIWMALALAVFAVAITVGLVMYSVNGRHLHRAYAEQAGHVGGELIDVLTNIWAVKAFAAGARERTRLRYTFDTEARAQRKSWMFSEKARVLHDVLLWMMAGSMLVWALMLWTAGQVSAGDVVVVSTLVFRILHGSRDLAVALVEIEQHVNYLGETLRVVGVPHEVVDAENARPFQRKGGAVRFENVSFGYAPDKPILKNFSLDIKAGQKVGVVGPSGAGKSTIIHLVQRLHDVQSGRVLIDGQDAGELTQESLRFAIAVVPQEISLFHRTVMENIRFGRPEASDDEVREAAAAAHCQFIDDLPYGYQTLVGDRGAKLSGGQRQRVGIARAILKNAPIVVLDEATSALDTESEIEVQRALDRLTKDRTVIAVAHRLSTLSSFDRIVVLMDGAVAEDGSIEELLDRQGLFARMSRLQVRGMSVDMALDQAV
ncbi:ABC transporter ATP-binding protein [Hansschlegelia plantiphila]|uniref:ABC transporter ATP-binding protein n=1 Tax=Hansschlegelia plantiphila TaxID=374655 RepID=A0A9W6J206_9HYPH|nr:ABC transporter ATP-binding protein [Hansschlegelia plantiphila]GLK69242.1 ABC transporter ATP-binding protein [Hansschlegelia plantiphila]